MLGIGKPQNKNISLSPNEKISIIGNLTTMISSGIPLYEAVDSLLSDATGNSKRFLSTLRDDLVSGNHVYVTLSKFPNSFDKVTVSVIKASEEAGTLETALKDLTQNIRKEMEFAGKIKGAMVYPLIISVVFVGVLLLILVVVIPKISTVFSRLGVELPLPTKILIFMSDGITKNGWQVLTGMLVIAFIVFLLFKKFKGAIFALFFRLPLISKLIKEIDLTRFSRNLYLLLTAGLPITTALELSKSVVMRKKMEDVIEESRQMILSGKKLSEGLSKTKGEVPQIMLKLIEVGEKSGSLPKAMFDISEFLDYKVSETLKTLTVLMEPLMLIIVGAMVGGMMLAIIAPIYGLIGSVGAR